MASATGACSTNSCSSSLLSRSAASAYLALGDVLGEDNDPLRPTVARDTRAEFRAAAIAGCRPLSPDSLRRLYDLACQCAADVHLSSLLRDSVKKS